MKQGEGHFMGQQILLTCNSGHSDRYKGKGPVCSSDFLLYFCGLPGQRADAPQYWIIHEAGPKSASMVNWSSGHQPSDGSWSLIPLPGVPSLPPTLTFTCSQIPPGFQDSPQARPRPPSPGSAQHLAQNLAQWTQWGTSRGLQLTVRPGPEGSADP